MLMLNGISLLEDNMSIASRGGVSTRIVGPQTNNYRTHKCPTKDLNIVSIEEVSLPTRCVCTKVNLSRGHKPSQ